MKALLEMTIKDDRVRLYTIERADIRQQLLKGIAETPTKILVLVDDDSRWSAKTLNSVASAFNDPSVGGVNTMQYVRPRLNHGLNVWESCGALNLVRRNILHSAVAFFHKGQVLNLSGRTAAYRTKILQEDAFKNAFVNDYWKGKYLLRTGDDSFITSWIVNRGWNTAFMNQADAVIVTTVNDNITYLNQVMRWSRDTARHYLRDLVHAIKCRNYDLCVRSVLNWGCNYTTDFLVLWELGFLVMASVLESLSIFDTTQLGTNR
jgi:cellulose synthase/poly-beta-1,6-N-acetylglucosamine synthase-like glycosyltransferase